MKYTRSSSERKKGIEHSKSLFSLINFNIMRGIKNVVPEF